MTFQSRHGLMLAVVVCSMANFAASFHSHQNAILTDAYLRGIMDRLGDKILPDSPVPDGYVDYQNYDDVLGSASISDPIESEIKEYEEAPDNINEPRERSGLGLSLRDQEYLKHSSLLASTALHQHEQSAGSEKGTNGLGSTPSTSSATTGKTENVLPAYCNPPNPCPIGYTAEDGCLEEFENTAAFSREYQASQDCMCDTEHMFDCPASSLGNAKGRASAKNRAAANMVDSAIRKIMSDLQSDNPYLQGDKLPIAAKKGNRVA